MELKTMVSMGRRLTSSPLLLLLVPGSSFILNPGKFTVISFLIFLGHLFRPNLSRLPQSTPIIACFSVQLLLVKFFDSPWPETTFRDAGRTPVPHYHMETKNDSVASDTFTTTSRRDHEAEIGPFSDAVGCGGFDCPTSIRSTQIISIVIAAHNEHSYIERTLMSVLEASNRNLLREIIIVDDKSEPSLETAFDPLRLPGTFVRVIRNSCREGLIRSKIIGGNAAHGDIIVFLDAHVKPDPYWLFPIVRHINSNYRRLVVPKIFTLNPVTWEPDRKFAGSKMIFKWNFKFFWFDDANDWVPLMSGGLFAISKKWWTESGGLDERMQVWGGENIEQSLRTWLCGGEIVVASDVVVSHVFRENFPYEIDRDEVFKNKVRVAELWLDEFRSLFYAAMPLARRFVTEIDSSSRLQRIKKELQCKPFSAFIERFQEAFFLNDLLPRKAFQIRLGNSNDCVTSIPEDQASHESPYLATKACDAFDPNQNFAFYNNGRNLYSVGQQKCLDGKGLTGGLVILQDCDKGSESQYFNVEKNWVSNGSHCLEVRKDGLFLARCDPPIITFDIEKKYSLPMGNQEFRILHDDSEL